MQTTVHATPHRSSAKTAGFAHPSRNIDALGVEQGMIVVDLGSGSGHYALELSARVGNGGRVYAVDVQRDLLRRTHNEAAKRGLTNCSVIWADLEKPGATKLSDGSVDLVLMSNILFQLEDKVTPLREARRILKPRGRLAIIDWRESYGGMGPHKSAVVAPVQATEAARAAGFAEQGEFRAGAHHYGLIFGLSAGA